MVDHLITSHASDSNSSCTVVLDVWPFKLHPSPQLYWDISGQSKFMAFCIICLYHNSWLHIVIYLWTQDTYCWAQPPYIIQSTQARGERKHFQIRREGIAVYVQKTRRRQWVCHRFSEYLKVCDLLMLIFYVNWFLFICPVPKVKGSSLSSAKQGI